MSYSVSKFALRHASAGCRDVASKLDLVLTFLATFDEKLAEISETLEQMHVDIKAIKMDVSAIRADLRLLLGPSVDELLELPVSEEEVMEAQAKWANAIASISSVYLEGGDYVAAAGAARHLAGVVRPGRTHRTVRWDRRRGRYI